MKQTSNCLNISNNSGIIPGSSNLFVSGVFNFPCANNSGLFLNNNHSILDIQSGVAHNSHQVETKEKFGSESKLQSTTPNIYQNLFNKKATENKEKEKQLAFASSSIFGNQA